MKGYLTEAGYWGWVPSSQRYELFDTYTEYTMWYREVVLKEE